MTQLAEKATQVVDGIFKSFGGSGSNPDVPQFKTHLQSASDEQVQEAHNKMWREIIEPLARQGGQALPTNIVEEVSLVTEEIMARYQKALSGSR